MKEIKLLPHNQIMVDDIECVMAEGIRKIFFSEACSLGKTFIFMYLVNKYFKDKKVLYICPTYYIWKQVKSNEEFKNIEHCVDMCCYAAFNNIKEHHFEYDVYFIDEAHHLFSDIQGSNIASVINTLIENNKDAYAFGMTATPYHENKMVGNAFFDVSIMGKDIFQAVKEKLLQPITYAIAIDDVVKTVRENPEMQEMEDAAILYNIDTTKMTIENIMNDFSYVNHWLLYFPLIQELEENIEYFKKHFPDYKVFVLHSEIECENVLDEFEAYEGKAILASVGMILEGVHPKTVHGVLSYRNVHSYNLFMQMIGRLGVMSRDIKPVFVDIYKSYRNIRPPINNPIVIDDCHEIKFANGEKVVKNTECMLIHSSVYEILNFSNLLEKLDNSHQEYSYRGITWISDYDLSRKLGKKNTYVFCRKSKGLSYEQIIDRILDSKPKEERSYRGITWINGKDLSRKLFKSDSYVNMHKRKGLSYEQIIDQVLDGKYKTYRGITWESDNDLSIKLGKHKNYVSLYKSKGLSYEQIIDQVLDYKPNEYRGITWENDKDLSIKLGKCKDYVNTHKNRNGLSYEQIIDRILDSKPNEYRGITWESDSDLSRKLGKANHYVGMYKSKGMSYEEIIDKVLDEKDK